VVFVPFPSHSFDVITTVFTIAILGDPLLLHSFYIDNTSVEAYSELDLYLPLLPTDHRLSAHYLTS
jgi:hypothetical protein